MSFDKTTTTTQDPWAPSRPYLEGTMAEADRLLDADTGFRPYEGGTYVRRDPTTNLGLSQMQSLASNAATKDLGWQGFNFANNTIGAGGQTGAQRTANTALNPINSGQQGIDQKGFMGLLQQTGGPGAIQGYLDSTARGDWLNFDEPASGQAGGGPSQGGPAGGGPGNSYFMHALDNQASALKDDVNRSLSMNGRYGSGAHVGALGDTVGQLRMGAMSDQFNRERQNQIQAAGMIGQEQQARTGQQAGLLGQLAGVQGQNLNNQMAANQLMNANEFGGTDRAMQATQMTPQIYEQLFAPSQKLMEVGAANEDLAGRKLQSDLDYFNQNQMQDWQRLAQANAIFSGAGQMGGTQSQVASPGAGGGLLSLLLGGLGLFGA